MAQISYNSVYFPYPMFTNFEQIATRDDEGDTDFIGIKYRISVQCLIIPAYLPLLAPDLVADQIFATTSPADIMAIIRNRLSKPRKQLSVQFNGIELIPYQQQGGGKTPQAPDNVDAMNGPKPGPCHITNLTNNSFLLTWSVEAFFVENLQVNAFQGGNLRINKAGSPILFNRWSEELQINSLNLCRRTRKGKFMIRSDNVKNQIADKFTDQFAILGVPDGWLRESSSYTVDPSGLAISYVIVDKQIYKTIPEPAYEAEGYYTESCSKCGALVYGDCHVNLKGSGVSPIFGGAAINFVNKAVQQSNDPQAALCNLAIAVAMHKIQTCLMHKGFSDKLNFPASGAILQTASLRLHLWKCEVSFDCRFLAARPPGYVNFTPFQFLDTQTWQQELDYTPNYPVHGSAGFLMQAAAYYDPALGANWKPAEGQWDGGIEPGTGGGGKT